MNDILFYGFLGTTVIISIVCLIKQYLNLIDISAVVGDIKDKYSD